MNFCFIIAFFPNFVSTILGVAVLNLLLNLTGFLTISFIFPLSFLSYIYSKRLESCCNKIINTFYNYLMKMRKYRNSWRINWLTRSNFVGHVAEIWVHALVNLMDDLCQELKGEAIQTYQFSWTSQNSWLDLSSLYYSHSGIFFNQVEFRSWWKEELLFDIAAIGP